MKLVVVGCAGSFPGPQSPASCYLVQAEHEGRTWTIALDLGNGALGAMQHVLDPRSLDALLLTHLHPDHCLDVCSLYVMLRYSPDGAERAVPVHAPAGASERLGRAYGVVEPESFDGRLRFSKFDPGQVMQVGPFSITAVRVQHPVEAYGLRIEADGTVLAYTGDTDACPALDELLREATLALVDCAYVDGRDDASRGVHMSGSRAARAALDAGGVQRLMLTHIPSWNDPQVCHDQAAAVWPGQVELAKQGQTYEL